MGISELWKLIEQLDIQEVTTLEEQAVAAKEEWISQGVERPRSMVIGVDTPVVMSQCISGAYGGNHFSGMVPLEIFFYKLCRYSQAWSTVVFVFDGPLRPSTKRGRPVPVGDEPDWYGPCLKIIKDFGFHTHMAPGEAEAELGALSDKGIIDLVVTGDSDAFVFGAKSVIRSSTVKNRPGGSADMVGLFKTSRLLAKEPRAFSRGGLLLIALLIGGDYAPGVKGCGAITAYGLAKCGFGDTLLEAARTLQGDALRSFIGGWLDDVRDELRTNSRACLRERNHVAADNLVEHNFASNDVISFYVNPVTSYSPGQDDIDVAGWIPKEPDIGALVMSSSEYLGSSFRLRDKIFQRFHSNVWPGALKQMLLSPTLLVNPAERTVQTAVTVVDVLRVQKMSRRTNRLSSVSEWFRVSFSTQGLSAKMEQALTGLDIRPDRKKQKTDVSSILIWVPSIFLSPFIQDMQKVRKATHNHSCPTLKGSTAERETSRPSLLDVLDATLPALLDAGTPARSPSITVESLAMGASESSAMGAAESSAMGAAESSAMGAAESSAMGAAESSAMGAAESSVRGATQSSDTIELNEQGLVELVPCGRRDLGELDLTTIGDGAFTIEDGKVIHLLEDD